ncbi:HAD family hydrolase [Paenibacillus sp. CGMCC 1.16610]|uniref:HAD family hydrolase n=2 Tax=Paenibacillus TaxID=44249 RepID=A0ABU3RJQ6_9BACL|nr:MULTISPECIES: HAD family hydrolase [Paenibacillus]MBA2943958.1 HAD family hydrolase [Paenibacillus sp. CGMCC 1.16610]MDU0204249.1 HAD family hydrolase [Paenibacillus sp. PFR10]MEC0266457.1 HAD family hydrolase [Paenibacillus anseongense]MVQ37847.1 HAD-IA family hydrolase [Paenibacillus anseongense]
MSPFFSPTRKKVIFFDMNNTILDRRQCFDSAFLEVMNDYTARWEPDETLFTAQDVLQSYKMEWSRHRKAPVRSPLSPDELRHICLRKALHPLPVNVSTAFTRAFFEQVEEQEDHFVALFPGVEDTLEALSQNYKLAIISNGNRRRLQSNLDKLKLTRWITEDRLFSSEKDGPRKPHPAIFERALKTMNAASSQSVMVGNSWRNDVVGAASSGLDAIWIHPGNMKKISERRIGKQKVVIIRSFKQLIYTF